MILATSARKHEHILVLGAGNFGTSLAQHLAEEGHQVTLWTRQPEVADAINKNRKNPKYLNTLTLSDRIRATANVSLGHTPPISVIVFSTPTQSMRSVLGQLKGQLTEKHLLICAAKGIELGTLKLPQEIIRDLFGDVIAKQSVFLSGPSFAAEIIAHLPTAVSMASHDASRAAWAQEVFHAPHFRVYTSEDPTGLEVAGALKNVIAIAAGAAAGLGYGMNTRAALITRGLAEITRVGVAMGAHPLTFTGLGGVGDLFLTCSSEKSRNYTLGFKLGSGEALSGILTGMGSVAEGYTTAKAAKELCEQLAVPTPIIHEVYKVLYEDKPIARAVMHLMTREAKAELDQ